jgi:phenylacetate-CoA ligase
MGFTQMVRERLDAWLSNRMFIPAFELSEQKVRGLVKKLNRYKPVLVDGYAESFNFLAGYIPKSQLTGFRPKGIVSSAQILPEQSRKAIEEAFGCKVFDKYGSREFSGIAYECEEHNGHHVSAESYIVEILKDGRPAKPGELGEIIITDLNNYCVPLIRYRIGDLAIAMDHSAPCPCGRGLPKIGDIEGRVQAIIAGTNGCYLPGTFFAHLFKDYDYIIQQYQVVQELPGEINLLIIKAPNFDEDTFQQVLSTLKRYLGADMKIHVDFVQQIPMVRTGKHQGTISRLGMDYQNLGDMRAWNQEMPGRSSGKLLDI